MNENINLNLEKSLIDKDENVWTQVENMMAEIYFLGYIRNIFKMRKIGCWNYTIKIVFF